MEPSCCNLVPHSSFYTEKGGDRLNCHRRPKNRRKNESHKVETERDSTICSMIGRGGREGE